MSAPKYGGWNTAAPAPNMVTSVTPLDTRGPKRLWTQGPGFVIRERGDTDGTVEHEYLCPVHGRFTARVSRRDVPDWVACPKVEDLKEVFLLDPAFWTACGLISPWSPSTIATWKSSGEVTG